MAPRLGFELSLTFHFKGTVVGGLQRLSEQGDYTLNGTVLVVSSQVLVFVTNQHDLT